MNIRLILSIAIFACSQHATAFKLDTHVWIGSQVIEDVASDGAVNIPPFGDFAVDSDIIRALRSHPKAFLYGNVGPDFFPDVLTGQVAIHPGAAVDQHGHHTHGDWNTDDWFRHLLKNRATMSEKELAFAYGFIGHGASDFWAHTYVNTYAGNIFDLMDGDQGEAEIRHYTLEGFINDHTPISVKANGQILGKGIAVINAYPGELPSNFIVEQLMLSEDIQDHIDSSPHLKIMKTLKDSIPGWIEFADSLRDPLYKAIGDIFEEHRAEFNRVHYDKQDINEKICNLPARDMPDSYAAQVAVQRGEAIDKIHDDFEAFTQESYNNDFDNLEEIDQKIHEVAFQYIEEGVEFISEAHQRFTAAEQKILSKKHQIEQKALELDQDLRSTACEITEIVLSLPSGIHEYAVDLLPFGQEINDHLVNIIDPIGVLGISSPFDPPDPLGLFGGGSSAPSPPKIEIESGNRSYFLVKIETLEAELAPIQAQIAVNPEAILLWAKRQDAEAGGLAQYARALLGEHQRLLHSIDRYKSFLEELADDEQVLVYGIKGKQTGYSTRSAGSVFCNTANDIVDRTSMSLLNSLQSLENDVASLGAELRDASDELTTALVNATEEIYTTKHQFNKKLQEDTNELLTLAADYTSIEETGQAFAEAEAKFQAKSKSMLEDICSDVKKVEAFFDEGALEAAPFVGAFLFDKYVGSAYSGGDGKNLYYEWFYFFLKTWKTGVDEAIAAYPDAQRKVVDAVLTPDSEFADYKEPLTQYLICEASKFAAVPSHAAHWACLLQATAESASSGVNSLMNEHDRFVEKYLLPGVPSKLVLTKKRIDELIEESIIAFARKKLAGNEAFELLIHVKEGSTSDPYVVNNLFSTTNNEYLTFDVFDDPFSERVRRDMHVKNGVFDPQKFAPAYNALVLAKLSLLGADELNRLVDIAGGHYGLYGTDLFHDDGSEPFNILINAIRTIDGDHQWLNEPPRYIRKNGPAESMIPGNMSYQYDGTKGFRLYQDEGARSNVFEKVFVGPVNAAIQTPGIFNFEDILPSNYRYRPCASNPFPNGEDDQACIAAWLIPVIHNILM